MADINVSSLSSAYTSFQNAASGDRIILANGTYDNGTRKSLTKTTSGTVTFMAQTVGGVTITGQPIDYPTQNTIIQGFNLDFFMETGNYMTMSGDGCQFTRNTVHFDDPSDTAQSQDWLMIRGNNCIVDHNEFHTKASLGNMLLMGTGSATLNNTKVFKNYFHDQTATGANGGETLRVGASNTAWIDFSTEIYYNRFEDCSGDPEAITMKGSYNNIHHNTLVDCNASLSLRHGNHNTVNDNVLINTGLRFFGNNHVITRNQIIEDDHNQLRGPMVVLNGDAQDDLGSPGNTSIAQNTHSQVYNCLIENNLLMNKNFRTDNIFCFGYNGSTVNPTFKPINNTIINNIISGSTGTLADAFDGAVWTGNTVSGNILNATGSASVGDMPTSGYSTQTHNLTQKANLTYRCCVFLNAADVGPLSP